MKNIIRELVKNPKYSLLRFRRRYLRFTLTPQAFVSAREYRSDSDNGDYASFVAIASKSQKVFDSFKRNIVYREVLEHVSREDGDAYLKILKQRNDGLLDLALNTVLISDSVGDPVKFFYEGIRIPLSPTTLRYVKVSSDLLHLFGRGLGDVAEIGAGYGGQCLVNDKLLNFRMASLFDLPCVNLLIQKYLNANIMDGAYATKVINEVIPKTYDLVISNYAFSELPAPVQMAYLKKVLICSTRGYLTMNTGLGSQNRNNGKLSLDDLRAILPKFEVLQEDPLTDGSNYIIVWGHNKDAIQAHFKVKS